MRAPGFPAPSRHALNSARYRLRERRGQKVYRVTANGGRLVDLLVRERRLAKDAIHTHAEIELALTHWLDDEARK
jgi:hypothetical protein